MAFCTMQITLIYFRYFFMSIFLGLLSLWPLCVSRALTGEEGQRAWPHTAVSMVSCMALWLSSMHTERCGGASKSDQWNYTLAQRLQDRLLIRRK